MKFFFCSIAMLMLLSGQTAIAQKNAIFTDVRYYPIANQPVYGASLGYLRQVAARKELSVRLSVSANVPNDKVTYLAPSHRVMAHLDISNRWKLSKKQKSNWYAEVGVSGLYTSERELLLICGTNLSQKMIDDFNPNHYKSYFSPGLSTAVSWEYLVNSKLAVGIHCLANLYFEASENFSGLLVLPSLRSAYKF